MIKKLLLFFLGMVLLLGSLSAARAETFTAYLNGAQQVPVAATSATGYARIVVNESAGTLTWTVVYNNLTSVQNAAHIHAPGAIGVNAAVAIGFAAPGGTSGTITGSGTITPTQLAQLRAHLGYVNVHSANFPNGEIRGQLGIDRPVDFDGDGRQDYSILRFPGTTPNPITYFNLNSTSGIQIANWGDANTDFPVPGDYDGDAVGDLAVYRAGATATDFSHFYVFRSSDNTAQVTEFGMGNDEAVCRDYDGDGKTDITIFRRGATTTSNAEWWIRQTTTNTNHVVIWGITGDTAAASPTIGDFPVPGDYDGDGKFDIAVYRIGALPATNSYIVFRSSDSQVSFTAWGNFASDYVVPGDYDGDGKYDYAVARASNPMVWFILQSSDNQVRQVRWGNGNTDLPAQGDYDGDAVTDVAVYRPGATAAATSTFWVFNSFSQTASQTPWGTGADFAVNTFDER